MSTVLPQTTPQPRATHPEPNGSEPATDAPAPRRSTGRGRRLLRLGLLLLVVAGAAAYFGWQQLQPVDQTLVVSGTVEVDEVAVSAEVGGRIVEMLVDEGSAVRANQVVARLDDSILQLQLRQATAAELGLLELQLEKLTLRAPIDGTVIKRLLRRGEVVAPGGAVATVADQSQLELTLYVPEREIGRVRVGQPVAVRADPFPGRTFAGEVKSIGTRAEFTPRNVQTPRDRQTLVFAVTVRVPNADGDLKPGLPVDATFG